MSDENITLSEVAKELNSNGVCWDILFHLSRYESMSFSEIQAKVHMKRQKMDKEIARLEGPLLISSVRDSVDKRVVRYSVTINGLNILKYKPNKDSSRVGVAD